MELCSYPGELLVDIVKHGKIEQGHIIWTDGTMTMVRMEAEVIYLKSYDK